MVFFNTMVLSRNFKKTLFTSTPKIVRNICVFQRIQDVKFFLGSLINFQLMGKKTNLSLDMLYFCICGHA
jgi:hypothetical protein